MKNLTWLTVFTFVISSALWAQGKKEVIYEYKKYEKFDLGNLDVEGELTAPGDVTVAERERDRQELELFVRRTSEDLARKDQESFR
jgi:hypothetical protein